MEKLKLILGDLPHSKVWSFIQIYFQEYEKSVKSGNLRTRARYGEKEYVKLLKRKTTNDELQREVSKMIDGTTWGVHIQMIDIAIDLQKYAKYVNG